MAAGLNEFCRELMLTRRLFENAAGVWQGLACLHWPSGAAYDSNGGSPSVAAPREVLAEG